MLLLQNINNETYTRGTKRTATRYNARRSGTIVETIRMRNDCDKNAYHDAI